MAALPRRLRSAMARRANMTPLRLFNLVLNRLEMKLGRTRLISRPYELCIDVSNKCNLTCPFCPTGRREHGRGKGHVALETFSAILDELAPYVFSLELFNWGEAFFNPELPQLIEYAHRRKVETSISSNLSFRLKEDYLRSIVTAGLTNLTASIDGADQQSYEVYRRGGNFALAVENLRTLVRLRRELNSRFPRLCWQYLIFAHNERRVDEARQLAHELGLDSFAASGGLYDEPDWAPAGDHSYQYLEMHPNRCPWLWRKAVFHWDGGMASCCSGFFKHDDFGDWQPGAFRQLWNNEKFVAARRIWTEKDSPLPDGHFCTSCDKVRFYRGLPLHSKMKPPPQLREQASG
ncbi:MAG: radical SAM protein [Deltaproteobacteria bacterium]|nr:radical SAM protein [Deltaproteobacteria bacterium]